MDRTEVDKWVAGYEQSWRSPGTDHLREIFTLNATYRTAPYEQPYSGLNAIATLWDAEREGPDERFTLATSTVAVDGLKAVVQADVHYVGPPERDYRNLWVITFDEDCKCSAFEEWPFSPNHKGWFAAGPSDR